MAYNFWGENNLLILESLLYFSYFNLNCLYFFPPTLIPLPAYNPALICISDDFIHLFFNQHSQINAISIALLNLLLHLSLKTPRSSGVVCGARSAAQSSLKQRNLLSFVFLLSTRLVGQFISIPRLLAFSAWVLLSLTPNERLMGICVSSNLLQLGVGFICLHSSQRLNFAIVTAGMAFCLSS